MVVESTIGQHPEHARPAQPAELAQAQHYGFFPLLCDLEGEEHVRAKEREHDHPGRDDYLADMSSIQDIRSNDRSNECQRKDEPRDGTDVDIVHGFLPPASGLRLVLVIFFLL